MGRGGWYVQCRTVVLWCGFFVWGLTDCFLCLANTFIVYYVERLLDQWGPTKLQSRPELPWDEEMGASVRQHAAGRALRYRVRGV